MGGQGRVNARGLAAVVDSKRLSSQRLPGQCLSGIACRAVLAGQCLPGQCLQSSSFGGNARLPARRAVVAASRTVSPCTRQCQVLASPPHSAGRQAVRFSVTLCKKMNMFAGTGSGKCFEVCFIFNLGPN